MFDKEYTWIRQAWTETWSATGSNDRNILHQRYLERKHWILTARNFHTELSRRFESCLGDRGIRFFTLIINIRFHLCFLNNIRAIVGFWHRKFEFGIISTGLEKQSVFYSMYLKKTQNTGYKWPGKRLFRVSII